MDRDVQQTSRAVPRFASFQSNVLPIPILKPLEVAERDQRSPSTHNRGDSRKRHRQSHIRRTPSSTSNNVEDTLPGSKHQFVKWDESPATFAIDLEGDSRNLDYGSNYEVPSYTLAGHCIALGSNAVAHRTVPRDKARESISKQVLRGLRGQKVRRVRIGFSSNLYEAKGADFVPLQPPKVRKRKSGDHTEDHAPPQNLDNGFQPLAEDRCGPGSAPDAYDDFVTDQASSDDGATRIPILDERLRQRRATLLSQDEQDSRDCQSWLALIKIQDEMDGFLDISGQVSHTNAERRSNAEVDISIYEKALKSVTDAQGREQIYFGMMSKAPVVWERRKISSKWQIILNEHPSSQRLWKRYLDFYQCITSDFKLEVTWNHYLDCLSVLQGARERAGTMTSQHLSIYIVQVYILLRLSLLLREGDYTELAVAIWQALLEFEFSKPDRLQRTAQPGPTKQRYDESLSALEKFWDSEVPRIGEPNAKGWLNFENDDDEQDPPPAAVEKSPQPDSVALKSWADAERKAGSCSRTASRSIDGSSDDPYNVVFFSDIKPALIESPASSDRHTLLAAFLCFCHLPPYTNDHVPHTRSWYNDQFTRNELLYDNSVPIAFLEKSTRDLSNSCSPDSIAFAFAMTDHPISSDILFSAQGRWFSAFKTRVQNPGPVPTGFILATLETLVNQGVGGDDLAEYLLAFELQLSPTTVLKSAKGLLKKRPSSLRLYNAYALIQNQLGNTETAKTVFDKAIQMSTKFNEVAKSDVILLWRSRIWVLLLSGQRTTALEQLLGFGLEGSPEDRADGNGKASATARLRLHNALTAGRDHMLSLNLPSHAVYYSELLVLFDYLINSTSLLSALSSFTSNLHLLNATPSSSVRISEALFRQSFARLLYVHILHKHPYSPRTVRSFLAESIAALPGNTIFLSLYAWNESRFRIDDRVRGIMRDILSTSNHRTSQTEDHESESDNIIPHLFAIHTDLHRGVAQGSNPNAVRGTFERALRSDGAAHNAGLWKLYFLSEHANGNMDRARDIVYRAIRACPWVKALYMLAFDYCGDVMSQTELKGIYDLMVEKELRIRVSL